ncbi:hypothetical protein RR48_14368, partial [Papilio machaon]
PKKVTLHSIVVTSNNEMDTGEEVLEKVRKTADAKEGWVRVERIRKAKDRKIIMGFRSKEEREKMKERLKTTAKDLSVEEVKNKDPMLLLRDVLNINTDEDIQKALKNQNRGIFGSLDEEENRIEIKYRRKTRNPHTSHIVVAVSPLTWQKAVEKGYAHIDLQRIKVEDQTPLIQCTRCLGFGHSRRFCTDTTDLCSHCGGPHLRSDCADIIAGIPPKCQNCHRAKLTETNHNSFDRNCPIRKKWDTIARSTVAYC